MGCGSRLLMLGLKRFLELDYKLRVWFINVRIEKVGRVGLWVVSLCY